MLPCKYQTGDFLGGTIDKEKMKKDCDRRLRLLWQVLSLQYQVSFLGAEWRGEASQGKKREEPIRKAVRWEQQYFRSFIIDTPKWVFEN